MLSVFRALRRGQCAAVFQDLLHKVTAPPFMYRCSFSSQPVYPPLFQVEGRLAVDLIFVRLFAVPGIIYRYMVIIFTGHGVSGIDDLAGQVFAAKIRISS